MVYSDTWLRHWREKAELSQAALAQKVKKSKIAINHFERGHKRPAEKTAARIADVLSNELGRTLTVGNVFPLSDYPTPGEIVDSYFEEDEQHRAKVRQVATRHRKAEKRRKRSNA